MMSIAGLFNTIIIIFLTFSVSFAGESDNIYKFTKHIQSQTHLTGPERMMAMQKYLYQMPEKNLISLLNEIGPERFMRELRIHNRSRVSMNKYRQQIHGKKKSFSPSNSYNKIHDLRISMRNPEERRHLCRSIANYLLNRIH